MGRVLLAAAVIGACAAVAHAGGATRKVEVESDPPGAKVYLNEIGSEGAACDATPCTIDAPIGETPIILQLAGYEELIDQIAVPRKAPSKKQVFKFSLKSAVATIVIDTPAAKGATVQIDGEDKGKVPVKLEVPAGPHTVLVTLKNKTLYDDSVDLASGDEKRIATKAPGDAGGGASGGGGSEGEGEGSGGGGGGGSSGGGIVKTAPETPRRRFVSAGVQVDVGFRRFEYQNPAMGLNPIESEDGQVVAGPAIELWPAELFRLGHLRGLSIFARVQFGLNHQEVTELKGTPPVATAIGARTAWSSLEISVRHLWVFGGTLGVEVSGGFVRDQMGFDTDSQMALDSVPSTDYRAIRIGGKLSLAGAIEPYVAGENRLVLSGGDLQTRFMNPERSGYRVAAGFGMKLGPLAVRAEGSLLQYSWTFPTDTTATGASDRVYGFSGLVGYQY